MASSVVDVSSFSSREGPAITQVEQALAALDPARAVAFLQSLIRLCSVNPPGDEAPVAETVARALAADGVPVDVDRFAPNRADVIARLRGGSGPALVFSGHLDTVAPGEIPWARDPFSGELAGGRVWGRGASDMKSGLAAMVMAIRTLARAHVVPPRDLLLAATAGEEVDCCGAARLVQQGALAGAGGFVIGEPTGGAVATGHRGALWVELETAGRTAHGSMPSEGVNAVMHMHALIARLADLDIARPVDPLLGSPTLAVTGVRGGVKVNIIPDRCTATIDIRTLPGQSHEAILAQVQSEIDRLRVEVPDLRAEVRVLTDRPPVMTDPAHPLVQAALSAASAEGHPARGPVGMPYFTEASVYVPATGFPAVLYGPGGTALAHQPNESVDVDAYLAAIRFYIRLALRPE